MRQRENDLIAGLRAIPVPPVPSALLAATCEEGLRLRASRRHRVRTRNAALALLLAVAVASISPPGRAAAEWLARQVGLLSPPTLEQRGSVPGSARAMLAGTLSNGDRYEIVVKRIDAASFARGATSAGPARDRLRRRVAKDFPPGGSLCFQVDWPTVGLGGQGGMCLNRPSVPDRREPLSGGVMPEPLPGSKDAGLSLLTHGPLRPAVFIASTKDPDAEELRVARVGAEGKREPLLAELIDVGPATGVRGASAVKLGISVLSQGDVRAAATGRIEMVAELVDGAGAILARRDLFPLTLGEERELESCIPRGPASRSPRCRELMGKLVRAGS
jgi:hypothetical protein